MVQVQVSTEIQPTIAEGSKFLCRVITIDEIYVHCYDPKTM